MGRSSALQFQKKVGLDLHITWKLHALYSTNNQQIISTFYSQRYIIMFKYESVHILTSPTIYNFMYIIAWGLGEDERLILK
jgi:hypothetical protein